MFTEPHCMERKVHRSAPSCKTQVRLRSAPPERCLRSGPAERASAHRRTPTLMPEAGSPPDGAPLVPALPPSPAAPHPTPAPCTQRGACFTYNPILRRDAVLRHSTVHGKTADTSQQTSPTRLEAQAECMSTPVQVVSRTLAAYTVQFDASCAIGSSAIMHT